MGKMTAATRRRRGGESELIPADVRTPNDFVLLGRAQTNARAQGKVALFTMGMSAVDEYVYDETKDEWYRDGLLHLIYGNALHIAMTIKLLVEFVAYSRYQGKPLSVVQTEDYKKDLRKCLRKAYYPGSATAWLGQLNLSNIHKAATAVYQLNKGKLSPSQNAAKASSRPGTSHNRRLPSFLSCP